MKLREYLYLSIQVVFFYLIFIVFIFFLNFDYNLHFINILNCFAKCVSVISSLNHISQRKIEF